MRRAVFSARRIFLLIAFQIQQFCSSGTKIFRGQLQAVLDSSSLDGYEIAQEGAKMPLKMQKRWSISLFSLQTITLICVARNSCVYLRFRVFYFLFFRFLSFVSEPRTSRFQRSDFKYSSTFLYSIPFSKVVFSPRQMTVLFVIFPYLNSVLFSFSSSITPLYRQYRCKLRRIRSILPTENTEQVRLQGEPWRLFRNRYGL